MLKISLLRRPVEIANYVVEVSDGKHSAWIHRSVIGAGRG
jgi:hypothetical protein